MERPRNLRRRAAALAGLALPLILAVLGGCTTTNKIVPYDPFPDATLQLVRQGMPADAVRQAFGQPHQVFEVAGGEAIDDRWDGLAYVYFMDRDPRFGYTERFLENRFIFELAGTDTLLNYWELEQGADRYFEAPKPRKRRQGAASDF